MAHDEVLEIAKRRGFFWPSFEIYGSCAGFYTYGPLGSLLKLRIEQTIRDWYVNNEGCLVIEAPVLTPEDPWVASGHVKSFTDMIIECQKCGEPYRADHLLEEKTKKSTDGMGIAEVKELIKRQDVKCPKCGGNLENIYDYNLMFKTFIGPGKNKVAGDLRPETAQTTYMPFRRLFELGRKKLPLGVIQLGKSFRNEISPRQGLVRLREFTQAEVQFFLDPEEKSGHPKFGSIKRKKLRVLTKHDQLKNGPENTMEAAGLVKNKFTNEWIAYFLAVSVELFEKMGIDTGKLRCRQHKDDERSFYSSDTWDVEFMSDVYGKIELVGIADRTDYDLKRHQEFSRQSMEVNIDGRKFIPHVVEVAYGIDRPLYSILESCLKKDGDRVYFSFPPAVSPYQVAVFPLVKKDGLPKRAREIYDMLIEAGFYALYDEGFIGKLYYRQDEAGTPFCITYDYDSDKDRSATIRNRDDQKQIRVKIKDLVPAMEKIMSGQTKFEKMGKLVK
jgi:glycyl-tRNA synthetase